MNNINFIIFTSFFLIFSNTFATVLNQTNPQKCSKEHEEAYKDFYQKNMMEYDLLLADLDFKHVNCFFQVFRVNGSDRVLIWMDIKSLQIENYGNLYISILTPSTPPVFEEDLEIPLIPGSLNETIMKEKKGESSRDERVASIMIPEINRVLSDFKVEKKKKYYETLYLMNRINLDKLMNIMIADFFGVFLEKELAFFFTNWETDLIKNTLSVGSNILSTLENKFISVMDESIAQKTFNDILSKKNFVTEEYKKILNILSTYNNKKTNIYGRNSIGSALNQKFNAITLVDLVNFMKDFLITLDKKKNLDFQLQLQGDGEEEQFSNLFVVMNAIPIYQIQFFLFEKFELIGLRRANSTKKGIGSLLSKTPADNCGLTTNAKNQFIQMGINEKVLDQSMFVGEPLDIYVRCEKTVSENLEIFKLILKPNNDQECTMVVIQKDLGQMQYQTQVMWDTYETYGNSVSCMRYTRGVQQSIHFLII